MEITNKFVEVSLPEQTHRTESLCIRIFKPVLILKEIIVLIFKSLFFITIAVFRSCIPPSERSVENEIVLISGASRGIGKEMALQYASLGATVVIFGVTKDKNLETVAEIARRGYPKAFFYECDVIDRTQVLENAKKVQQEIGDVTILINNAGTIHPKPLFQETYDEVQHTMNINIISHFWTIQAFLPAMIKNNRGHIVAMCSYGGITGLKNCFCYCPSKFAVRGLMEALYYDLRSIPNCQVKLTTLYPYFVNTGIFKRATIRFPKLMPILEPAYVAKHVISAQRRGIFEMSVPKRLLCLNTFGRLFPMAVYAMVLDFLDVSVDE